MAQRNDGGATRDFRTLFRVGVTGDLTDGQLLDRFLDRSGEASELAFETIVRRHGSMVLRTCRAVLRHEDDARDAFQATFLVLVRKAKGLRVRDSLGPWLQQVAYRTALGGRSQRARRLRIEGEAARSSSMLASTDAESSDLEQIILDELSRLPSKDRAVLSLCALAGRTNEQAARELGLPVGTVQSRLHRARVRLRDRLARRGIAPASAVVASALSAVAKANVPVSLIEATSSAAVSFASRGAIVGSAPVIGLVHSTLRSMLMARLVISTAAVFVLGSLVVGGGTVARSLGTGPGEASPAAPPAVASIPEPIRPDEPDEPEQETDRDPSSVLITGIVVDEQGAPVPDAEIMTLPNGGLDPVRADAGGRFRLLLDLPRITFLRLRAIAPDGERQGVVTVRPDRDFQSEAESEIIVRPSRQVTIRVVGPDGEPVPGATAEVFSGVYSLGLAETDAEGVTRFSVPSDLTINQAIALKSGVGFAYDLTTSRREADGTPIPADPLPESIELALDRARTVRILVVDDEGRPLPGAKVLPWLLRTPGMIDMVNFSGSRVESVVTDESGMASLDWIPEALAEPVRFSVGLEGYRQQSRAYFDPFGDPEQVPEAQLARMAQLSGTVRLPDGSPAPGILVTAGVWASSEPILASRTEADGTFSMQVWPGQSFTVAVVDDRFAAEGHLGVVVEAGEEIDGLDFELGDGTILEGRLTQESDGVPMPGSVVGVTLLADEPFQRRDAGNARALRTDEAGRFRIRVGPGRFRVWDSNFRAVAIVEVEDQESIEVNLTIPAPDPLVPFTVIVRDGKPDGEPVPGALIQGRTAGYRLFETADDVGRFEFERVPDAMLLLATSPDGSRAGLAHAEAEDDEAVVVLEPAASASGRVVDLNGEPMAGVRLGAWLALPSVEGQDRVSSISIAPVETDDDGRFTIVGLVHGTELSLSVNDPKFPSAILKLGADQDRLRIEGVEALDLGELVYDPRR